VKKKKMDNTKILVVAVVLLCMSTVAVPMVSAGAVDDMGFYKQQMRQWEMNTNAQLSNRYMSQLADHYDNGHWNAVGGYATSPGLGYNYGSGLAILNTANTLANGVTVGLDTTWRMGKSMQIMNPPTYLQTKTPSGSFGEGPYSISGGHVQYWETLNTKGPDITRTHTDMITTTTPSGFINQRIETKTPASPIERFMMHNFPTGSYFDPEKTTIQKTYVSNMHYKTVNGNPYIQPSSFNTYSSYRSPSFNSYPSYSSYRMPSYSTPSSFRSFP
jgi:hypothetical protein